jgi:hypothetical protein
VIEGVERFNAELKQVILVVRHAELLVHFGIEIRDAGADDGVAAYVAEETGRGW